MDTCRQVAGIDNGARKDEASLFSCLLAIVDRLRSPDGCPWDRKQTEQDTKAMFLEEVYELVSAISSQDEAEIIEEIGDVMLLCVFLARIYEEKGRFSIADLLKEIISKLVRRHPHVFGGDKIDDPDEVIKNWTRIKNDEKRSKSRPDGIWASVPSSAPVLFQYYEYLKEHKKHGVSVSFDVDKERRELADMLGRDFSPNMARDIVLRVLVFAVGLAWKYDINPELVFMEEINRLRDNS